jgi:hypothetical protein
MKHFFALFIFVFISTFAFAKGCSGNYYIAGKAYGEGKTVLKNIEFTVTIGATVKTIKTDDKGNYEIEVPWVNACPSMRSPAEHNADNERLNSKSIIIEYNNKKIEVDNNWHKYARCAFDSKKQVTRKYSLHFT